MERLLPTIMTTVRANDTDIVVRSSPVLPYGRERIESDGYAVITELGAVNLHLSVSAAIEIGDALIRAAHHYRSHAAAHFAELDMPTEGEAA